MRRFSLLIFYFISISCGSKNDKMISFLDNDIAFMQKVVVHKIKSLKVSAMLNPDIYEQDYNKLIEIDKAIDSLTVILNDLTIDNNKSENTLIILSDILGKFNSMIDPDDNFEMDYIHNNISPLHDFTDLSSKLYVKHIVLKLLDSEIFMIDYIVDKGELFRFTNLRSIVEIIDDKKCKVSICAFDSTSFGKLYLGTYDSILTGHHYYEYLPSEDAQLYNFSKGSSIIDYSGDKIEGIIEYESIDGFKIIRPFKRILNAH